MENTINKRIGKLIEVLARNQSEFARLINSSTQNLNNIVVRGSKPGADILESILKAYPQVDALWLLCGVGEMQKDLSESKQVDETELVKSLKRENEILIKNNDFLLKNQERLWVMVEGKKQEANEYPRVEIIKLFPDIVGMVA